MAKSRNVWVCTECGFADSRWSGQCRNCGAWNTLKEEVREKEAVPAGRKARTASVLDIAAVPEEEGTRLVSGIGEFDRVLGGGVLPGAVVLAGGAPGVGKSTLLLQAAREFGRQGSTLYVSGEESPSQIKVRARRLGIESGILLMAETDLQAVLDGIGTTAPRVVIIDSIQTLQDAALTGMPGSIAQVRSCAGALIRLAKSRGIPVFMIGHVTKEGTIAGPRVLEHMVDTVLSFESERNSSLRVLRAVKNRFGSTDEIGLFEMHSNGMQQMQEAAFLFDDGNAPARDGAAVFCAVQGNRPLLLELQALCAHTQQAVPRRLASGVESSRLLMLCAVLEKKMGFRLSTDDVFVNAAGGIRIRENAADLALAAAIVSSLRGKAVGPDTAFIGEVGLTGEVRRVSHLEQRLSELGRLGIRRVIVPRQGLEKRKPAAVPEMIPVSSLFEAFENIF